jgi:hypothetical protein
VGSRAPGRRVGALDGLGRRGLRIRHGAVVARASGENGYEGEDAASSRAGSRPWSFARRSGPGFGLHCGECTLAPGNVQPRVHVGPILHRSFALGGIAAALGCAVLREPVAGPAGPARTGRG